MRERQREGSLFLCFGDWVACVRLLFGRKEGERERGRGVRFVVVGDICWRGEDNMPKC